MNENSCCIINILKTIKELQCKASIIDSIPSTCDRPFLGECCSSVLCNTRPISFYTCNNQLMTMPYELNGVEKQSSVFRVEKVDECCCMCRVLAANTEEGCEYPYVATNSFFTVNTECICALRCLSDTFVEIC